MESAFSLLSQKEKEIRKIQENKMRLKFPRFAGKKINIIPDSVWYIIYLSTNLNLMFSQLPSSLKGVAQFPELTKNGQNMRHIENLAEHVYFLKST